MTNRTKMIIITSDEDVIRQFSLHQTNNVRVIDFNHIQQTTSNENDDNLLANLARLAELPQSQLDNDQVQKRTLDFSNEDSSKATKTSRKSSLDITCVICGDHAIGFNYDALSCASCKAFFLRNANKDMKKIRCLTDQGRCSVEYTIQRKCPKCRLEKCLAAGMKKEFLQTEEQKQKRRKTLKGNRNQTSVQTQTTFNVESSPPVLTDVDNVVIEVNHVANDSVVAQNNASSQIKNILSRSLSVEDQTTIQNLQSSFISFFQFPKRQVSNVFDFSNRQSTLVTWSNFINQIVLRYINFIRQNSEFEHLCLNDRIILTKFNVFPILPISKCYSYQHEYTCPYDSKEEEETHQHIFSMLGLSNIIADGFINIVISLVHLTGQDPALLALLLLILFFTPGLSASEEEPPLTDPLAVYRTQSQYTKILWNYLVDQYGQVEAVRRCSQLFSLILQMQIATRDYQMFFREQCTILNAVAQITPLMQSVLNIS